MDEKKNYNKKNFYQYSSEDLNKIESLIDNMKDNELKSNNDGKSLGSMYFLKDKDDKAKIIEENNESKIPKDVKKSIIELLKKDTPYDGVRSQTEYLDDQGVKRVPSKSVFNKIKKSYQNCCSISR